MIRSLGRFRERAAFFARIGRGALPGAGWKRLKGLRQAASDRAGSFLRRGSSGGRASGLRLAAKSLSGRPWRLLVFLAFLPAAAWLSRLAAAHPYFAIGEITVSGVERLDPATVVALSGVREGQSIWSVSLGEVERKLETHPWIRRARVARRLPRALRIVVTEWKPRALVALDDLYYVDPSGRVFSRAEAGTERDLPFITGLSRVVRRGHSGFAASALREAIELLDALEKASLDLRVSELHIDRQAGIEVFLDEPALAVEFGWGGWATKVGHLGAVLARWQGERGRLARIDLTYRDQAVVRMRGGRG